MITVFTPVFNRRFCIDRLYQSLIRQTDHDFEWLVVDDGSTDSIEEYFDQINDAPFAVRFFRKENGGKHTCMNRGADLANGEYFLTVDSDDYLTDDAIEKIKTMIATLDPSDSKAAGVAGLKIEEKNGKFVGTSFDADRPWIDCTSLERKKHHIAGDKAEVIKTEILRRYKFPEFPNEKFLTENCVWYPIAGDGYYFRWFNEPIYVCEYLEDGLTKGNRKNCFYGEVYTASVYRKYEKHGFPLRVRNNGQLWDWHIKEGAAGKKERWVYLKERLGGTKLKYRFCRLIFRFYKAIFG